MKRLFPEEIPCGTFVRLACQQQIQGPVISVDCRKCDKRWSLANLSHPASIFLKNKHDIYVCAACSTPFPWDPESDGFHFWITVIKREEQGEAVREVFDWFIKHDKLK